MLPPAIVHRPINVGPYITNNNVDVFMQSHHPEALVSVVYNFTVLVRKECFLLVSKPMKNLLAFESSRNVNQKPIQSSVSNIVTAA